MMARHRNVMDHQKTHAAQNGDSVVLMQIIVLVKDVSITDQKTK